MIKFLTSNDIDNYLLLQMQKKIQLKSYINSERFDSLFELRQFDENLIDYEILGRMKIDREQFLDAYQGFWTQKFVTGSI